MVPAFGLPTTSTRSWLQQPTFSVSLLLVTVKFCPELNCTMPLSDHPPATLETNLLGEWLNGDCPVNAAENAFFWFRSELP
jgi:hypothetical protein